MINKKYLIIGIIILVVMIIVVFVFYFLSEQDLCKKINDETLKQKCLACESAEDPVDSAYCKENVYTGFVFLKKDKSLCNDLIQNYKINECKANLEKVLKRGDAVPKDEQVEGGYIQIS